MTHKKPILIEEDYTMNKTELVAAMAANAEFQEGR